MKIIHNEEYYKLKCIEYFFDKGLIVCGNQATECMFYELMVFYLENRRYRITVNNIEWGTLYKNKERFLEEFRDMLNKVRTESQE